MPILTADERETLLEAARSLNERLRKPVSVPTSGVDGRPGDDYNARGDLRAVLTRAGWKRTQEGKNEHWCRPGKQRGTSATLKDGVFYVFSSNALPFEPGKAYAPFAVYAMLERASDYAKAAKALRVAGYGNENHAAPLADQPQAAPQLSWPLILDVATILANPQPRPKVIIENLIYTGSKVSFSGPSKARKTFFQLHFCLCIALGRQWYGLETTQGRVLYVNLELHSFSFQDRVQAILKKLDATLPAGAFDVWHLRGLSVTIGRLQSELARRVEQGSYALICLDPLYKCLGARNENSATEMGDLLNRLESIGHAAGAATLAAHHYAKGSASAKEAIDRASGSGVVGRDGDAILTLTPHEVADCFTLEAIVRDFPPLPPFVLKWEYPCFGPDYSLDPFALKQPGKVQEVPVETPMQYVTSARQPRHIIVKACMEGTGRGEKAVERAFTKALGQNLMQIERTKRPGTKPLERFYQEITAITAITASDVAEINERPPQQPLGCGDLDLQHQGGEMSATAGTERRKCHPTEGGGA